MDTIKELFDIFLHIDQHLANIIANYGIWTNLLLFIVVFCETGLVVTPFLPGDSLLFATGTFAAKGALDPYVISLILAGAAIIGDTVNYWAGAFVGPKIFTKENVRFLNKKYLERTHRFYEKHGGKTIIIARFIPIIRTFAPFVAGIGAMSYLRFIAYNVIGGIIWVFLFVFAGYYFGNLPFVKNNFSFVIVAIVILSVMPAVIEYLRSRRKPAQTEQAS
jgi:membrane-associated protein